jgi:hypothetical protein
MLEVSSGDYRLDRVTGGPYQGGFDTPTLALSGATFITAGNNHFCATKGDGTLWCWGANDQGQLGQGTHDRVMGSAP